MALVKIIRATYIRRGEEAEATLRFGPWYKKTDIAIAQADLAKESKVSSNYSTTYASIVAEFIGWEERDLDTGD